MRMDDSDKENDMNGKIDVDRVKGSLQWKYTEEVGWLSLSDKLDLMEEQKNFMYSDKMITKMTSFRLTTGAPLIQSKATHCAWEKLMVG